MAVCNVCGVVGNPPGHAFEDCKPNFCRHGMTSWFNGDCQCRVEWLLEREKKLIEGVKKILKASEGDHRCDVYHKVDDPIQEAHELLKELEQGLNNEHK